MTSRSAYFPALVCGIAAVLISLEGCTSTPAPTAATSAPSAAASTIPTPTPAASGDGVETVLVNLLGAGSIAARDAQLWVITGRDVVAIDIATDEKHTVKVGGSSLDGIDAAADAIWVADFDGGRLIKIDPTTYEVVDRIAVSSPEDALEINGIVWVTNHEQGSVTLVDSVTDKVIKTVPIAEVGRGGPQRIAFGLGSVWIDASADQTVIRMDPATYAVIAKIPVPQFGPCGYLATTSKAVWVTGCFDTDSVAKIDPSSNSTVASVTLGSVGDTPVVIDDSIWVPITNQVAHLDPTTAQVDKRASVPELGAGGSAVLAGETLYVSDYTATVKAIPLSLLTAASP